MLSGLCASATTSDYLFQWGPWVFSCLLVVVGGFQAWWLMLTWKAIQKQVAAQRTAERAWIIITPADWRPILLVEQDDREASLNVFETAIKNVGRTPAHLTRMAMRYIKLDKSQFENLSREPEYGATKSLESVILVPEDSLSTTVPLQPSSILTAEEIQSIRAANGFLYFYGFIEYRDAFGETHETRVGFAYHFPQGDLEGYETRAFQRSGPARFIIEQPEQAEQALAELQKPGCQGITAPLIKTRQAPTSRAFLLSRFGLSSRPQARVRSAKLSGLVFMLNTPRSSRHCS